EGLVVLVPQERLYPGRMFEAVRDVTSVRPKLDVPAVRGPVVQDEREGGPVAPPRAGHLVGGEQVRNGEGLPRPGGPGDQDVGVGLGARIEGVVENES